MKNKLLLSVLTLGALLGTSCGNTESSVQPADDISSQVTSTTPAPNDSDQDEIEIASALGMGDDVTLSFDELVETAQIILIGEVTDDGTADVEYANPDAQASPKSANTLNTIRAIKVFKGQELIEGDTVKIYDNYAFVTNTVGKRQLVTATEHAPLYKGDKAIFLLEYNESMQRYIPIGTQGRFPLPEDIGKKDRLGFVNGLITGAQFREDYYKQLCEKFDIK